MSNVGEPPLPHSCFTLHEPPAQHVGGHGEQDESPQDGLLPDARHPQQDQAVEDHSYEDSPREGSQRRAAPAGDAGPAYHHGRDDLKLKARPRVSLHGPGSSHVDDGRYADENPHQRESQDANAVYRQPGETRRSAVAADGEEDYHRIANAQHRPRPQDACLVGDAGDPGSSGDEQDHAPQCVEHTERHDYGRYASGGYQQAVYRAAKGANGDGGQQGQDQAPGAQSHGARRHRAETHHRARRDVYLATQYDLVDGQRDDPQHGHRDHDGLEIGATQELVAAEGKGRHQYSQEHQGGRLGPYHKPTENFAARNPASFGGRPCLTHLWTPPFGTR